MTIRIKAATFVSGPCSPFSALILIRYRKHVKTFCFAFSRLYSDIHALTGAKSKREVGHKNYSLSGIYEKTLGYNAIFCLPYSSWHALIMLMQMQVSQSG